MKSIIYLFSFVLLNATTFKNDLFSGDFLPNSDEKLEHISTSNVKKNGTTGFESANLPDGWFNIGETNLDFKNNKGVIVLNSKRVGCTAIKLRVTGTPINLVNLNLTYDVGDIQNEALNATIQPQSESSVINLQCRVATFKNLKLYITQSGDCCCEDGHVCHKSGTSGGNCVGCGGDACKSHGGFAVRPTDGYGVHRNIKEIQFTYKNISPVITKDNAAQRTAVNTKVEILGGIFINTIAK